MNAQINSDLSEFCLIRLCALLTLLNVFIATEKLANFNAILNGRQMLLAWPLTTGNDPTWTFLGRTGLSACWRWTVPLGSAQVGLGALGELQIRPIKCWLPVPCATLQMGHLVWRLSMMTLWTDFKQQNFASDESIGPNEEECYILRS